METYERDRETDRSETEGTRENEKRPFKECVLHRKMHNGGNALHLPVVGDG